jgi:hypothetical protein
MKVNRDRAVVARSGDPGEPVIDVFPRRDHRSQPQPTVDDVNDRSAGITVSIWHKAPSFGRRVDPGYN